MEGTHAPCHPTGILPTPRRSWTELVPEAVLRCPTYTIDGVPKLSLAKRYQERHIKELQYSLVGRISSVGDDGFDHAYALIRRAWRPEGDAKFSEIASSEFFVTFSLPSDYEKVHRSAPWMVDGHLVEVQPWWPGEFPDFADFRTRSGPLRRRPGPTRLVVLSARWTAGPAWSCEAGLFVLAQICT